MPKIQNKIINDKKLKNWLWWQLHILSYYSYLFCPEYLSLNQR